MILQNDQRIFTIPGPELGVELHCPAQGGVAAADWWEAGGATGCVAAYRAIGAASQAASYVNLNNPGTYNLTSMGEGWNAVNGWTFDGLGAYLKTGITPTAGWSAFIRYVVSPAGYFCYLFGEYGSATSSLRLCPTGGPGVYFFNGEYANTGSDVNSGTLAIVGQKGYINGVDTGLSIPAWSGAGEEIYLGGYNKSGSLTTPQFGSTQAFAIYDDTSNLPSTPAAVLAISLAMAAL